MDGGPKLTKTVNSLPPSLAPRGLSRVMSAGYINVSGGLWDEMVEDGRMPKPKLVNGRKIWDRYAIDEAFATLGEEETDNEWDEVLT